VYKMGAQWGVISGHPNVLCLETNTLNSVKVQELTGHAVAHLVKATSRKVAGSVPYCVIRIFH